MDQTAKPALLVNEQVLVGNASATGVMDNGGDVIAAGAFDTCLGKFLRNGFISLAHDWDRLPIAYPRFATEKDGFLRIAAEFHSTDEAQSARTIVLERIKQGLSVALSIGFHALVVDSYSSGRELLRSNKSIAGLDFKSIARWNRACRLIRVIDDLYEVSIVAVPMNPKTFVTHAKARIQRTGNDLNRSYVGGNE